MKGQRIQPKYLAKLPKFFEEHSLEDFNVIYDNEKIFADFLDVNTFKFTNSGTSALYLILTHIKNIRESSKPMMVFIPAFCHISSLTVPQWMNIDYTFVDVDEDTLSMSPDSLMDTIRAEGKPDVVLMTNMGGYTGIDTFMIKEICDRFGIIMIEDSAHAFGQKFNDCYSGTIGDFGIYSFSNPKILTAGEGGAIVCRDHDLNIKFEELIYQGCWYRNEKINYTMGLNFIMSNWLTELLKWQLEDLDEIQLTAHVKYTNLTVDYNKKFFSFPSDNEYYAPSFLAYEMPMMNKMIVDSIDTIIHNRYKNMSNDPIKFPVAQKIQDSLVYWNA